MTDLETRMTRLEERHDGLKASVREGFELRDSMWKETIDGLKATVEDIRQDARTVRNTVLFSFLGVLALGVIQTFFRG